MSAPNQDHPALPDLHAFGLGQLDPARSGEIEKHVADCDSCCHALQSVSDDTLVNQVREAVTLGGPVPAVLPPASDLTTEWRPADVPEDLARHPRYRVKKLLGRGGMGAVFQAEHGVMRRLVALKIIDRKFTADAAAIERFHREIRAAARLPHPNIVTAYDAEQAGDTHFLVMEYIDGVSLDRVVKARGPMPVAEACDAVRQAALGLQHAHEQGMVHRDVKPGNLIRTAGGVVKVLDFGLAEVASERAENRLTGANVVMGTPDFIAPEQAEDTRAADQRADVYALGCTLYFLLTGRPPFSRPSTLLTLLAHRDETAKSVCATRPDVPAGLAVVLERMMAKAPADRFRSAAEVAEALAPFTAPKPAPRSGQPRRRWLVGAAAAVLFVGALAAAAVVIRIPTTQGDVTLETDDPTIEVVVTKGGKLVRIVDPRSKQTWELDPEKFELSMADQPDGLTITLDGKQPFVLKRKGAQLVTITRRPAPDDKPPATDPGAEVRRIQWDKQRISNDGVSFSPDDRSLLAGAYNDKARVWNLSSGELRFELDGAVAAYTPDGKYILSGSYDLRLSDAETGKRVHEPVKHPQLYGLKMSPDCQAALTYAPDGFRLWSLPELKLLHFWPCDSWRARPYFTPDGKCVLISFDDKPPLHVWDVAAAKEAEAFHGLAADRYSIGPFTADGRQVVVGDGKDGLQVIDALSGKVVRSLAWKPNMVSPALDRVYGRDARRVLESYEDGSVRLFDVESGKELACQFMKGGVPHILGISPDQRYASAASYEGLIVVWRLPDPPADKP